MTTPFPDSEDGLVEKEIGSELLHDGKFLTLRPLTSAGGNMVFNTDAGKAVGQWRCGNSGDGTTIPAKFLPASCRG